MTTRQIIGRNIRMLRKAKGLTIFQLGNILNINSSFLGLIERGARGTNIDNLCKIADFFEVSVDSIIRTCELNKFVKCDDSYLRACELLKGFNKDELEMIINIIKVYYKNKSTDNKATLHKMN